MVITSFSCCTDTPWCSITNLHGGKSLVLSSTSLDHKTVAGQHCSGRGGICEDCWAFRLWQRPLFYRAPCEAAFRGQTGTMLWIPHFLSPGRQGCRTYGSSELTQHLHSSLRLTMGAAASHSSGFAFSRVDPRVQIGA